MSTPALSRTIRRVRAASLVIVALALLAGVLPVPAAAQADDWRPVAPGVEGVDYRRFTGVTGTSDPVHVARMDRANHALTLESLIASGYINVSSSPINLWTGDGVQPVANSYEDTINAWGDLGAGGEAYWGNRSDVLVAINADLWNTSTYYPAQGMVQSGWFNWRFTDSQNRSGFGWNQARQTFIGSCASQEEIEQRLIWDLSAADPMDYSWKIAGVNVPRADESIYLYTPQYGIHPDRTKPADKASVEVVVRLPKPLGIGSPIGTLSPGETLPTDILTGTVTSVVIIDPSGVYGPPTQPEINLEFDEVVLSAYGNNAGKLDNLSAGQAVGLNLTVNDLVPLSNGCGAPTGVNWANTYTAVGTDIRLVENGEPLNIDTPGVAPRTAIAYNNQYIFFVVAEGRALTEIDKDGNLVYLGRTGISLFNLAKFIDAQLGADFAVNLDGGGSSAMIVNGYNVSHTTDLYYCPQYHASSALAPATLQSFNRTDQPGPPIPNLPMVRRAPTGAELALIESVDTPTGPDQINIEYSLGAGTGACQRRVPNGIAMVAVKPKQTSTDFFPGLAFSTVRGLQVRQGPGKNYKLFGYVPYNPGSPPLGIVLEHANGLNGVFATGTYWWHVEINGLRGWVDEAQIQPLTLPGQRGSAPASGGN